MAKKISLALILFVLAPLAASATVCQIVPLEVQLKDAPIVFVATVTTATNPHSFVSAKNGEDYRVRYKFEIREHIKGDPSLVPALYTTNIYHAYESDISIDGPETRLLPGDNVLVIADSPGEIQVARCSPSRVWKPTVDEIKLLHSFKGAI